MKASTTTRDAVRRASQAWQTCAVHVRGELRAHGVRGELRRLDDYASGQRGDGVARFLAEFAEYARQHGMPANRLAAHLGELTADVVTAVYAEPITAA